MALHSVVGILEHVFTHEWVWGVIHLPGGQRIITCSEDGSLRVWNLKSGKQIGEDWRDGEGKVVSKALSPDGKKVVSGGEDGAVRLWDIDTCKVIAIWTGHTNYVASVCWSRDGRNGLSGSSDGTTRKWDVESGETVLLLERIVTGHKHVWAVVYSPDTTLIATGGRDEPRPGTGGYDEHSTGNPACSVKIWNAKTGELVTLKGHRYTVNCLAWTKDGKTLISGSWDFSIRTWDTKTWKQTAVLDDHTSAILGLAISPNDHILASASNDRTSQLWNLDNGQPISSPLQHAGVVRCVSFSGDGKLLATGSEDRNAYTWDVAAIVREAGFNDLLSDPKAKSALHSDATRRPPAYRVTQGFFDGVPAGPSRFSVQGGPHSSESQGSTLLRPLFHHTPSNVQDTFPSSPLDWARNLLKRHRQSGEGIELQGRSPAVVEVPFAPGQRRNACAREKRKRLLPLKNLTLTASSSRPPKPNATQQSGTATQTQPSSQPQPVVSTTPAISNNAAATSSTPSRPDVMLRQAGLWTRFWLFIGCLSPEYQDGHH